MEIRNLLTDLNILILEIVDLQPLSKDKLVRELKNEIAMLKTFKERIINGK